MREGSKRPQITQVPSIFPILVFSILPLYVGGMAQAGRDGCSFHDRVLFSLHASTVPQPASVGRATVTVLFGKK